MYNDNDRRWLLAARLDVLYLYLLALVAGWGCLGG